MRMRAAGMRRGAAVAAAWLALAAAAGAQVIAAPDETPIEDVLEIVVLDRQLLAIDARGGGQTTEQLELGEEVLWRRTRGQVGTVLTDRRILMVGGSSASWQERRYRRTEVRPAGALLGDRIALTSTNERALAFTTPGGLLFEYRLGPNEYELGSYIGANAGVVLTSRKALGFSAQVATFVNVSIGVRERIVDVTPRANLVTVRTSRRLLIYRGPTGSWEERRLDLVDHR